MVVKKRKEKKQMPLSIYRAILSRARSRLLKKRGSPSFGSTFVFLPEREQGFLFSFGDLEPDLLFFSSSQLPSRKKQSVVFLFSLSFFSPSRERSHIQMVILIEALKGGMVREKRKKEKEFVLRSIAESPSQPRQNLDLLFRKKIKNEGRAPRLPRFLHAPLNRGQARQTHRRGAHRTGLPRPVCAARAVGKEQGQEGREVTRGAEVRAQGEAGR